MDCRNSCHSVAERSPAPACGSTVDLPDRQFTRFPLSICPKSGQRLLLYLGRKIQRKMKDQIDLRTALRPCTSSPPVRQARRMGLDSADLGCCAASGAARAAVFKKDQNTLTIALVWWMGRQPGVGSVRR